LVACELVDVGVTGLLLGAAREREGIDELSDELADVGGELPAFLCGALVGVECRVDLPVDLLDCRERVGSAEHFGAVLGERDVDRTGVLPIARPSGCRPHHSRSFAAWSR
jgi:hypothetical protein